MYSFTNRFSGPTTVRQRIRMINSRQSGLWVWWRYLVWVLLMGGMLFACRHTHADYEGAVSTRSFFPLTNATRTLASELDKPGMPWFCLSALLDDKDRIDTIRFQNRVIFRSSPTMNYPEILCLRNNHMDFKLPYGQRATVFINGQKSSVNALTKLLSDEVDDLLIYEKRDDMPGANKFLDSYRIFISTTHKTSASSHTRVSWRYYLLANAVSDYPLGKSSTFSMNALLEATFFNNKLAFVKRTETDHLKIYDEYTTDIDLYINGIPTDLKGIESVHVREVDKLYTRERSFDEWADGPKRQHRFTLYVQTAPKRAKRDSTYYVFSPFYSGDF